ncbi:MAG: exodeoxyribonuclease VII large subunit [Xanthomonadales bacterium]
MARSAEHVYTPSELNLEVKLHLEAGFPRIVLEGEISNLARPASGHLYFSLKDDRAQVRCAMFRSAAQRAQIRPANGMLVQARGRISLYEPRGEYQFIVDGLREAGEGLLQRRFEELKKKLEAEGLFDSARKQPLPPCPARIALVTSASGAAVRDLLHVLERRWPVARVRLYAVRVQGAEAPDEIRRAIEAANRHGWADLLIVGRGGGSLEDLMAFNDEAVARAVAASRIPLVSAVGHETDFSICDFVADLRAPTPSAAAELATPDRTVLSGQFERNLRQLQRRVEDRLQRDSQRLDHLAHRLQQRHPVTRLSDQGRQLDALHGRMKSALERRLDHEKLRLAASANRLQARRPGRRLRELDERLARLDRDLNRAMQRAIRAQRDRLAHLQRTLTAVGPEGTIARGYAVLRGPGDTVVTRVDQVEPDDRVSARLSDGELDLRVERRRPR